MITNCDDDLFAASNEKLGVEFDWVITAEQARGYKPRTENFEFAFERIDVPRERILHVAQSLFHDHVPAKALGMTTVWIDRRQGKAGTGATPPADGDARSHRRRPAQLRGARNGAGGLDGIPHARAQRLRRVEPGTGHDDLRQRERRARSRTRSSTPSSRPAAR